MTDTERELFDVLLEQAMLEFPQELFDDMPIVVDDEPDDRMLQLLNVPPDQRHEVRAVFRRLPPPPGRRGRLTRPPLRPFTVHLFRESIVRRAGGWTSPSADERVFEEIKSALQEQIAHRLAQGPENHFDV